MNPPVSILTAAALAAAYVESRISANGVTETLRQNYGDTRYLLAFAQGVVELRKPTASAALGDLSTALKRAVPQDENGKPTCAKLTYSFKKQKTMFAETGTLFGVFVVEAKIAKKSDFAELAKAIHSLAVKLYSNDAEKLIELRAMLNDLEPETDGQCATIAGMDESMRLQVEKLQQETQQREAA